MMTHKGCGGNVEEDFTKTYDYEGMKVPAMFCNLCGKEILGDTEIEVLDQDGKDIRYL